MRNMSSISDRRIGEAVEAYLGREGIELLDRGCGGFIDFVGRDTVTSELVLLAVQAGDGTEDSEEEIDRSMAEAEMLNYLAQAGEALEAGRMRLDIIHIFVMEPGSRGILRHHRAAL